jgi:2,4-dienoyl-CoA reductase [(3E)-enoyl-CoA-producing], peroxisomal
LAPVETLSYRAFRTVIEIDLLGTYNTAKACFPYLKKSKGCIINVSATLHYQSTLYQVILLNTLIDVNTKYIKLTNFFFLKSHASAAKAGVDALSRVSLNVTSFFSLEF